ncbi:hypothetical protein Tco_0336394 [Tanacetum coccineum]
MLLKLLKYGLLTTDSVDTPLAEKSKLDADLQGKQVDAILYRGMIGPLMYLTSSRPDLIYVVCLCARYQAKPIEKHLQAMHSQPTDYGFQFNKIPLYSNNKSAIALCYNNVQHSRAKHIDVRYHFIKEQVDNGIVKLYFVWTEYQLADIFTKPLPIERFNFLFEKLSIRSMSSETLKQLLSDYDCDIRYHPRKANVVADTLSRKEREPPLRTEAQKPENIKNEDVGGMLIENAKFQRYESHQSKYSIYQGSEKLS